jgi:biopolymer transport protein ExbD
VTGSTASFLTIATFAALAGCSRGDIRQIELQALANGDYVLDGVPTAHAQLTSQIKALTQKTSRICIEVMPIGGVPYAATKALMLEIQKAGVDCVGVIGVDKLS